MNSWDAEIAAIRQVLEERDRLRARVAELESERGEWDRKEDSWKHAAIKWQGQANKMEAALDAAIDYIKSLEKRLGQWEPELTELSHDDCPICHPEKK